ncbi:MAG: mycofactocin precursor MftA [Actinomycetota bacterium]|nr:mycofactocin precursor MftA [Actinomycetota bacterium]
MLEENTTNAAESEETERGDETDELVTESLVEEVSIDGMCGVY